MAALMKRRSGWARSLAPAISSVYPSTCARVSTAHINAHTSKVALLRKLPDGWIHNISCGFKWVLAQAFWSHRISPVIWDFSLLVVVIAAGLVNSEWWKLDHSLLKSTSSTRWWVFSVCRPSKSLNILHHLLKKLTGWVVEEMYWIDIVKVDLWAQTHPFEYYILSFKSVQQWLLFPLFGNISTWVCLMVFWQPRAKYMM